MTGGADTRGIDLAAEGLVVEHRVDDGAEIDGSQPPQRETLDRVILERVVAGMIDCDDDEAVRRECRAEPCEFGRCGAVTVGQENERTPGPAAGVASGAALPALKNGTMGGPIHCGVSRASPAAGYQIVTRSACVLAPRQS